MTRVYYKDAVGCFIVFDVTRASTFDAVDKWKTDLDSKVQLADGSPLPCVLLANKCDQAKEGLVKNSNQMDDFCKEKGFVGWFETSAKENINIDDSARFLVQQYVRVTEGLVNTSNQMDDFCKEKKITGWFETSAEENINIDERCVGVEKGLVNTSNQIGDFCKENGFAGCFETSAKENVKKDEIAGSPEKKEHLYKILVIGEIGTGKTAILKRYVHQFFSQHYRPTISLDFALKLLNWGADTIIRLQLWDIAGQARFSNITRVYYKDAVGCFIVFDVTRASTFDAVVKWKTDLDSKVQLADGSPVPCVLLANKCDQAKEGLVNNSNQMDTFCKEKGFVEWFETSAKENINIDDSARVLVQQIMERMNCPTMATSVDMTQDAVWCDLCTSNQFMKSPAKHHCKSCNFNLCESCVGNHIHSKNSARHDIIEYKDRSNTPKFPECPIHPGKMCELKAKVITTTNSGTTFLCEMCRGGSDETWISGVKVGTIKRIDIHGKVLQTVTDVCQSNFPRGLSISRNGTLVYCDYFMKSVKIIQNDIIQTVITLHDWWYPVTVCSSSSFLGDILVLMKNPFFANKKECNTKLVRYSGSLMKQEIQHDYSGQPLFSSSIYINRYMEENGNQDICVQNDDHIVVVNQSGQLRFRYDGKHPPNKYTFTPQGIATDSKCHILVADLNNNYVHVIDKDGEFLYYIDNCDLVYPKPISVDSQDRLWVGCYYSGTIKVIQYMDT